MRKLYAFLFTAFLLFSVTGINAQVSAYTFTQVSGTYTAISGGTVLGTATDDDQQYVDPAAPLGSTAIFTGPGFPIGFTFTYNGISFDRVAIENNGWICLGQSSLTPSVDINTTSQYAPLSSVATNTPAILRNRIAGFGRDLVGSVANGSELRIQTIGSAPNRVCVIQWKNYHRFSAAGTGAGDIINFQIRLNETSNVVELAYGANTFGATLSTLTHVGLGGTVAADFNNRSTTTNWNTTTAGATNADGCSVGSAVTVPASGLIFTYTPPPPVPPANDNCASAVTITCGGSFSGNTTLATLDGPATSCSGGSVAPDVWYKIVGTGGNIQASLCGSGYNTKIDVYTGACGALVCVGGNDDFCGTQSQFSWISVLATTYYIRVHGSAGATGSYTLSVTCPPVNDLCTGAIPITCGTSVSGNTTTASIDAVASCNGVTLNSAPGVWYSFVGNGQLITLNTCTGTAYDSEIGVFSGSCGAPVCVTANDDFCGAQSQVSFVSTIGTTYYILVTGFSTGTGAFTLSITCAPAIANDLCTGAININCGQTINASTSGAGIDAVPFCTVGLSSAPGVWYSFVGTGTDNTLSLCGSSYDTEIGVFTGTCGSLVCVAGNDDFCGLQSQVTIPNTTFGVTYYVLVTGFGAGSGAFTLTRTCAPPPNDLCANAININCGQVITGATSLGTVDVVPGCTTTFGTAPGVWYKFTGDGSPVTISLCGSAYDTKLGVFTGSCGALVCVAGNDDFCGVQSQVTFNTNGGFTYYILVTGFSTASGAYTLTRTCAPACSGTPSPGTVTPATSTVCRNTNVTLTTSGYSPNSGLTFQWSSAPAAAGPYTPIVGANSNVYTFPATATAYYTVTVTCSGSGGAATTSPPVVVNVDGISHINVLATPSSVCVPGASVITGTAVNGIFASGLGVLASSGTVNLAIPDGNPTGVSSSITVPVATIPNAASMRVRVNLQHTWVGDISVQLTSPCGTTFTFDRPGVPASTFGNSDDVNGVYVFDATLASGIPEVAVAGLVPAGNYAPTDANGVVNSTWAAMTFPCSAAGTWTLKIVDGAGGDVGTLIDWALIGPLPGFYTHTLTGPGTISQNPPTGAQNQNASFNVSAVPAGVQTYVLTSTDPFGCSVATNVTLTVNPLPTVVITPPAPTICNGQLQRLDAYATPGSPQTFNSACSILIPGSGTSGNGNPYPCVMGVGGLPVAGVTVRSVTINNYNHTFPDDVDLVLVSPTGTAVILMSDAGGATSASGQNFTFQDGSPLLADNAFNNTGTYAPTNYGTPDNFPAPGPGSLSQAAPALSSFTGDPNGNWSLYAVDDAGSNTGVIGSWSITFGIPSPVVFTQTNPVPPPNTIFSDALGNTAYTGTPTYTVWVKPTVTTTYNVSATIAGCSSSANVTVTVNQLPTITTQPAPATQTICPGFTVTYNVVATGAGLTYQWQYNPGSGFVNLVNAGFISGVTTPTLTIANVQVANAGSYRVIVSGTCAPPATSNAVVLNVGSAPTITTQPVNTTACEGSNATISVVAAGTPTPTIYQWQVSTDLGVTWVNLTTGGSFTPTLTLSNVTLAMNNNRYRVIITNSCGMTITSNAIILTVNARPVVTATPLPARICLSDTLVPLVGSPTGGSWSGIGVSGFNFVPPATAVGTYTLTYTFTSAAGCTNTATLVAKVEDCPERIRLLSNDGVILYPNPNNGRFSIRINSTLYNYLGMKVYDMMGRLVNGKIVKNGIDQALVSPVFTGLVYGRVVPIDLSYLPSGTYLVKFYYDDGIRSSEKGFLVVITK